MVTGAVATPFTIVGSTVRSSGAWAPTLPAQTSTLTSRATWMV